jgi:hypothetical protein
VHGAPLGAQRRFTAAERWEAEAGGTSRQNSLASLQLLLRAHPAVGVPAKGFSVLHRAMERAAPPGHVRWLLEAAPAAARLQAQLGSVDGSFPLKRNNGCDAMALPLHAAFSSEYRVQNGVSPACIIESIQLLIAAHPAALESLAGEGAAAVAFFLAAVLTEIDLSNVCSCPTRNSCPFGEILRCNGRGQIHQAAAAAAAARRHSRWLS